MANAGLDILVHPDVLRINNLLIEEGDTGGDLVTNIERIRDTLRNALESGIASFLPRISSPYEGRAKQDIGLEPLLAGSSVCDALCIDDRCINKNMFLNDSTGRSVI